MKAVLNITRNVLVIPRIFKSYFARVTLPCYRSSKKKNLLESKIISLSSYTVSRSPRS